MDLNGYTQAGKGVPMAYKISVVVEADDHGYYAFVPELPGCQTQGDTLEEAMANIREATELYLETLTKKDRKALLSREIMTTSMEVRVA
jgi:predicted RNase H-like HicB family nuclease